MQDYKIYCNNCGKRFIADYFTARFCSRSCRIEYDSEYDSMTQIFQKKINDLKSAPESSRE